MQFGFTSQPPTSTLATTPPPTKPPMVIAYEGVVAGVVNFAGARLEVLISETSVTLTSGDLGLQFNRSDFKNFLYQGLGQFNQVSLQAQPAEPQNPVGLLTLFRRVTGPIRFTAQQGSSRWTLWLAMESVENLLATLG